MMSLSVPHLNSQNAGEAPAPSQVDIYLSSPIPTPAAPAIQALKNILSVSTSQPARACQQHQLHVCVHLFSL